MWTLTDFDKFSIESGLGNFFMSDSGLRNFLISDSGLRTFFEIDFKLLCKKYYTTMPYYAIQWMIMNLIAISRQKCLKDT